MRTPRIPDQWSVLGRYPDFRTLFVGDTVSGFGSSISTVALPLTAVLYLHASPLQMGVLGAAGLVPHLILSLPAGVWVGRRPYRRVLVAVDVARALLLVWIPIGAAVGALAVWQLYVVAALTGAATLFDGVVSMSYVPLLVERKHLLPANALTAQTNSLTGMTGTAAGGVLVQALTAPFAVALDAASFAVSAVCSALIRTPGPAAEGRERRHLTAEIADGLRAVFGHRILRAMVLAVTIAAAAGQLQAVVLVLYLARTLHLSSGLIGAALAVSGAATLLGALSATAVIERIGHGPTFLLGESMVAVSGLVLAAAGGSLAAILPVVLVARVLAGAGLPLYGINQVTLRQSLVPEDLLARVNATWRFLVWGFQPIGALVGGALGGAIGLRPTLVVGSAGMLVAVVVVACSPVRSLRRLPTEAPAA